MLLISVWAYVKKHLSAVVLELPLRKRVLSYLSEGTAIENSLFLFLMRILWLFNEFVPFSIYAETTSSIDVTNCIEYFYFYLHFLSTQR